MLRGCSCCCYFNFFKNKKKKLRNKTKQAVLVLQLLSSAFATCRFSVLSHSSYSALQQAGRNPSHATLNKYWTPRTSKLNFDDFCEILKCEKKTEESELMRAFKKMDVNGDGYILHRELEKALTTVSHLRHSVLDRPAKHCLLIILDSCLVFLATVFHFE